jgi:hypothetical protein
MDHDPLVMLEKIEAAKRSLRRGSGAMNPAMIENFLIALADEVVAPSHPVSDDRPNYRLQSVRYTLLQRLGKVYNIPARALVYDLTAIIDTIHANHRALMEAEEREQIAILEEMSELPPRSPEPGA